jgi:hypothetical protein
MVYERVLFEPFGPAFECRVVGSNGVWPEVGILSVLEDTDSDRSDRKDA